ncbi:RHS repeat-associated core domain-containing protein [Sorangium sp. So ce131]|uniref:RHS repeat-associated core domain-containing protein n=1 Tax=Sorangium sp. So ce131 TaxID=3133282 RepID=UPI003F60C0B9
MRRRWLWPGLALTLSACGGNLPMDDLDSSDKDLSREASPAAGASGDVAALGPQPALGVGVSPDRGELAASLPFPPLPARASFGPEIALAYSPVPADMAQGFGVGFSLSVPSIQMTTDWGVPFRGMVSTTSRDITAKLSLGSERLLWLRTDTVSGKPRIEYRLDASESAVRLFRYPQGGAVAMRDAGGTLQSVPFTGFEVAYPDGRREIYSEEAAVAEGVMLGSGFFATRWPLVHSIGPTGEAVSYEYVKEGDRSYLSAVRFAGGRSVYALESVPRSHGRTSHLMGFPQGPGRLYTKLTATFDGELMHSYCFVYAEHGDGGPHLSTHPDCQSLADEDFAGDLTQLTGSLGSEDKLLGVYRFGSSAPAPHFTRETPAEPLVRFQYTSWGEPEIARHELVYSLDVPDVFGFGPGGGSELFDINADGLVDILRYSSLSGTSSPSFNSGDLADANPFFAGAQLTVERTSGGVTRRDVPRFDDASTTSVFLSGDFDGDGRSDLAQVVRTSTRTELVHYPGRADRARPFASAASTTAVPLDVSRFARGRTQAIDLNADGKADLLTSVPGVTDSTWTALVNVTLPGDSALSFVPLTTGLKFPFQQGAGTELDNPAYRFLDANGDGLTDFAVLRVTGAGDKGICLYENQGRLTAYPAGTQSQAKLSTGALLFGSPSAADTTCGQGRFIPVPGLPASANLNAMWLIDANSDGDVDLVNVAGPSQLGLWLGRGEDGFESERRIPLDEGVSVDPTNKWNTRVLDIDADGVEEIFVYEPSASGGRIKVIDFNRDGINNRIGPDLLTAAEEGPGLRHALQYATSTDEMIRDARRFGRDDARVKGLPYPVTVVKRHLTAVGGDPPRVRELQYHTPFFNERERDFAGFGQSEELELGDDATASVVRRRKYQVSSPAVTAQTRRFFAGKLLSEEVFHPALTDAQSARLAASAADIQGISQTAETWSEEPYAVDALLLVHRETWSLVPPAPGPKTPAFLRQADSTDRTCGATGCPPACVDASCPEAENVTRTFTYDSTHNRLTQQDELISAVPGPNDTSLPERRYVRTYTYDAGWEARGVLTAVREESLLAAPSNRVLTSTSYTYGPDLPLPLSRTEPLLTDADALAALPAAVRAPLEAPRTRVTTYRYDAFGNVVETSDALGTLAINDYDPTGVLLVKTRNALGHETQLCYGTTGCALLTEPAPAAEAGLPARSLAPTHIRTPQGEVTLIEYDARHRPVRAARESGAETSYAYRDAGAEAPALVLGNERRAQEGTATALVERLAAFRADGLPIGQAVAHEAGGARVASFERYGRRGEVAFEALPYSSELGVRAAFDAGRFPSPPEGAARGATTAYDALGRVVARTDAAGLATRIAYEPWGQRVEEDRGATSGQEPTTDTRLTVARGGEVHAIVDELGNVHRYERDERGSLRAISLAGAGEPRRVAHDSAGNIVMTSLPGGLTRLWVRDARGRVTEQLTWDRAFAARESIASTYDALDRETEIVTSSSSRPDGWDEISLAYDARDGEEPRPELVGRLVEATVSDLASAQGVQEIFDYDGDGRLASRRMSFEAEGASRVYEQRWTYSLDGTVASYRDPFHNELAFTRTPLGAPSAITWSVGDRAPVSLLADITYDARGQLASYRVPQTKLNRQLGYDPSSGRLTHLRACAGEGEEPCALGALQDVTYDRRADGRVIAAREGAGAPGAASGGASYTYGPRGELLGAVVAGAEHTYTYTSAGQVAALGEGTAALPFDAGAAIGALPLPQGNTGELDAFGRLVSFGPFHGAEYDPWGRLRRVQVDGKTIVYGYDAAGERVAKRTFVREGDREVPAELVVYPTATTRDDGVERQSLVRLDDRRVALLVNESRVLSLVDDQLGAVRRSVDERGEVVLSADSTPFGTLAQGAEDASSGLASTELVLGFTGQLRDPDTGLVHMGARDYVPSLASFSTPDPYALLVPELCVTSLLECNPYTYVAHDPVNFVDETGLTMSQRNALGRAKSLPNLRNASNHGSTTALTRRASHDNFQDYGRGAGFGQHSWGDGKPPARGKSNGLYTWTKDAKNKATLEKTKTASQNVIYNEDGKVVGHIDFVAHGSALSGHGHRFETPGVIQAGHGAGARHYAPGELPPHWSKLPPNVPAYVPIGLHQSRNPVPFGKWP